MKKLLTLVLLVITTLAFSQTCPQFQKEQSNPYYLLFTSDSIIPGTGQLLTINNLSFVDAGNWFSNNTYNASWTNTSGTPLNINNFSINFDGTQCHYPSSTLAVVDIYRNTPLNLNYKVYDMSGKLLQQGKTTQSLLQTLPKNNIIILVIEGMKPLKLKL